MALYKSFVHSVKSKDWMHTENEDSVCMTRFSFMNDSSISVFAVADGMGGLSDGKRASQVCLQAFIKSFYGQIMDIYDPLEKYFTLSHYFDRVSEAVDVAFRMANRAVCQVSGTGPSMGTTLSVGVLMGDHMLLANVGDSPILYYDSEMGEGQLVSELQTLAEQEVELGKYERFSEQYFARDYVLTHYMGEYGELPESVIFHKNIEQVHSGDLFLLASDGAMGKLLPEEVIQILKDGPEPQALNRLFTRAGEEREDDQTGIFLVF